MYPLHLKAKNLTKKKGKKMKWFLTNAWKNKNMSSQNVKQLKAQLLLWHQQKLYYLGTNIVFICTMWSYHYLHLFGGIVIIFSMPRSSCMLLDWEKKQGKH